MSKKKELRQFAIATQKDMADWDLQQARTEQIALATFCRNRCIVDNEIVYLVEINFSSPTRYKMEYKDPVFKKL